MNKITLKDVSVFYQNNKEIVNALDSVSFSFKDKKTSVVIGPSGCGKTTLLNCLINKLTYQGEIFLNDKNIQEITLKLRNFSYLSQEIFLYPKMIVFDNIAFPLKNSKIDRDDIDKKVKLIAKEFGISLLLTRKIKELSLGQQQKVALAKALIKNPDVLLLDEPFSNLDIAYKNSVIDLLKKYIFEHGITTILVTHDMEECFKFADEIFPLTNGKLIGSFTKESILKCDNEDIKKMIECGINEKEN